MKFKNQPFFVAVKSYNSSKREVFKVGPTGQMLLTGIYRSFAELSYLIMKGVCLCLTASELGA